MSTSRILVWDLPTRLFHWLLTVGLVACFAFAQFSDEHSPWFMIHMILGIVLGLMVVMRVVWGVVGSRYARFGSFLFSPSKVLSYVQGAFTAQEPSIRWAQSRFQLWHLRDADLAGHGRGDGPDDVGRQ